MLDKDGQFIPYSQIYKFPIYAILGCFYPFSSPSQMSPCTASDPFSSWKNVLQQWSCFLFCDSILCLVDLGTLSTSVPQLKRANMKWLTLVASSSFIVLCTFVLQLTNIYTPFSSCHSSCSYIFITGHFTIHFPIFHLTRLLSTIDRMTHNSILLVGNLLSEKKNHSRLFY